MRYVYYNGKEFVASPDSEKPKDLVDAAKGYEKFFSTPCRNDAFAETSAMLKNKKIEEGEKILICKDCKKYFAISKKSQKFYIDHNLKVPARCSSCIKIKKQQKEEKKNDAS